MSGLTTARSKRSFRPGLRPRRRHDPHPHVARQHCSQAARARASDLHLRARALRLDLDPPREQVVGKRQHQEHEEREHAPGRQQQTAAAQGVG